MQLKRPSGDGLLKIIIIGYKIVGNAKVVEVLNEKENIVAFNDICSNS